MITLNSDFHTVVSALMASALFKPVRLALARFQNLNQLPTVEELNQRLCVEDIRFVAQGVKSSNFEDGYEPRIYLQGEVQTRDASWHDFFNALVWQEFPQSKKIINRLQFQLQEQRYPNKQRLPAENMLTLFDENGAVIIAQNPELLELIRQQRWHELFWQRRDEVKQQLQVHIFGHGLFEKSLQPYIGITAQCLLLEQDADCNIDALITQYLTSLGLELVPGKLNPLPILGMPGWCEANENEEFYSNKSYFRDKL